MNKKLNFVALILSFIFLTSCIEKERKESKNETFNLENYLSKADYFKLNIKKMPSGHLHIEGTLNGIKGNFILDTGAGATVIEEKNKEKFKMKTQESEKTATGTGGSNMRTQNARNNHFKLGPLELTDLTLVLINLDHVNNAFESMGLEKVDGVIGSDILTNNKAIIDYSNLSLYLKHKKLPPTK
jgi:predicted aspartyl protease